MQYDWNLLQGDLTRCPQRWGVQRESALFYRVYYILGGESWCRMDAQPFRLECGTLYVFPVMTPYDLWQNPDAPLEVLWFHAELPEDIFPQLVQLRVREGTAVYHVLQALRQAAATPAAKDLCGALLALVGEELAARGVKSKRIRRIDAWIEAHLDQEVRVEQLARLAGLERSYFSREFRREMHLSPQRYILGKKMSAAARALQRGASVAQAAAETGYLSEKAFSRAFKAYMEITPRDYKRSHIMQP